MQRCWSCELDTRHGRQWRIRSRSSHQGTLSESFSIRSKVWEICIRIITGSPVRRAGTAWSKSGNSRLPPHYLNPLDKPSMTRHREPVEELPLEPNNSERERTLQFG